ncbi:MAG TPA: DUF1598 domain-containing protein [Pirellulales bacterium]|jgi:hypothetical protein
MAVVLLAVTLPVGTTLVARGASQGDLLREQLDAGEFGPALELARNESAVERDNSLAEIAKAQLQAEARAAAYNTIAEITDGRVRRRALDEMASMPVEADGRGGGSMAQWGPLMNLITNTIQPDSWDDNGGPGSIQPFANGVYVDAAGVMRRLKKVEDTDFLAEARRAAMHDMVSDEVRRASPLRKVSLSRLEREIEIHAAAGQPLDEEMMVLAGLKRVQYVLAYPETGDIVIAGPASDWKLDREFRPVSIEDGQPVVRLDHLLVLLRRQRNGGGEFACSIVPTDEGLAKAQAFAKAQSATPLQPGQRGKFLEGLRSQLGRQQVVFEGIDPSSDVAQVLLAADHHMKLIGIGLEPGTLKVPSYLSMIRMQPGEAPPALDVLRWWFTLKYDALVASKERDAFEIRGQGVQVLSENELLTATGAQVHTGKADVLNHQFAQNFTKDFPALAAKYPLYADLRNIFDLALVVELLRAEDLPEHVGWHPTAFYDGAALPTAIENVPQWVDTVINHRIVGRVNVVAAVSGGVHVNARTLVRRDSIKTEDRGQLNSERERSVPGDVSRRSWWWD